MSSLTDDELVGATNRESKGVLYSCPLWVWLNIRCVAAGLMWGLGPSVEGSRLGCDDVSWKTEAGRGSSGRGISLIPIMMSALRKSVVRRAPAYKTLVSFMKVACLRHSGSRPPAASGVQGLEARSRRHRMTLARKNPPRAECDMERTLTYSSPLNTLR